MNVNPESHGAKVRKMLTQYQLKNKMKILLIESHKAPVVTVQMWVKTGSADEKKGEEGISHFIEHLLFKGTRKYGVGEIARTIESSGGELNAYTSLDHTVFHVTMSRDDLNVGLDCISELTGFPKFDPVEIDREREVVLEEIKRSFDNPHSIASQQLFSTVFKKHPYRKPVIGYDKNIKNVTPKVLTNYYHRRYVPSNMTLVVVGDFDKKKIKPEISRYYGEFKSYPLKSVKRDKDVAQKKMSVDYRKTEFQEVTLNYAFRAPKATSPDVPALDMLSLILGHGDSSRLTRRLRLEQPLVTAVSVGNFNPFDEGLFAVTSHFRPENFQAVHKIILEELELILSSPLNPAELDRARLNLEADEVFSLETVDGLARKVGMFQTLLKDPDHIQKYLKRIHSLTPKDVLTVARKYLRPENANVTLMIYEKEADQLTQAQFNVAARELGETLKKASKVKVVFKKTKTAKRQTMPAPLRVSKHENPIIKERLSNGALVILKRNPEIPVFHIKAGFLGGVRLETQENLGASYLLSNTWTSGSKKFDENQIAGIIEGCAGTLSSFGGRNSAGLTLESLTAHEKKAKEVLADVLQTPLFPQEIVSREAAIQSEYIRTKGDHPTTIAGQLFSSKMFHGHPYERDILGTTETLKKMDTAKIKSHWQKMVTRENAIFVAVGDFKTDQQLKFFEEVTAGLPSGVRHQEVFPVEPLKNDARYFSKSEKEQSHIILGYRGISFKDSDRYILDVLEAILAGQGGRLFAELREKASLAYSVSPFNMKGIETGYVGIYIGCSPEKGPKAIKMMQEELTKIMDHAPSEIEVQRAKRYLVGRNHIDLQRNGAQASSILFDELYDLDCEETFKFADHLKAITPEDVKRVAGRLFSTPSITVAVGPIEPW